MRHLLRGGLLGLAALIASGCSMPDLPSIGMFGSGGDGSINIAEGDSKRANPNAPLVKYAATIRIARYTDARKTAYPRQIGTGAERVSGLRGKDITLSQDVAMVVAGAMKARLDEAGFQVSDAQNNNVQSSNALFELGGVVKELTLNVKERDEIVIMVETTLKEISSGKVMWSGVVVEKNDRFAGISGNNKNDVAHYLRKELGIVTGKTVDAISSSLMAVRPDLFNLVPGTRPIPGVTVLVSPAQQPIQASAMPPAPAVPVQPAPSAAAPAQGYPTLVNTEKGMLLVSTLPGRAKVYLDSVYFGLSPLRLEIDPGVHEVSIKLEGYKMVAEKVSVRKGEHTEMDLNLER